MPKEHMLVQSRKSPGVFGFKSSVFGLGIGLLGLAAGTTVGEAADLSPRRATPARQILQPAIKPSFAAIEEGKAGSRRADPRSWLATVSSRPVSPSPPRRD